MRIKLGILNNDKITRRREMFVELTLFQARLLKRKMYLLIFII